MIFTTFSIIFIVCFSWCFFFSLFYIYIFLFLFFIILSPVETLINDCSSQYFRSFHGTMLDCRVSHTRRDITLQSIQISRRWRSKVGSVKQIKAHFSLKTALITTIKWPFFFAGQVTIEFYVDREINFIVFHSKNLTINEKVIKHVMFLFYLSISYSFITIPSD